MVQVRLHGRPIVEKPSCLQTTLASEPLHLLSQMLPQTPSRHTSTLPSISLAPSLSLTCPFTQSLPLALGEEDKNNITPVTSLLQICNICLWHILPLANGHMQPTHLGEGACKLFAFKNYMYHVSGNFCQLLTLALEVFGKGKSWKRGKFAKISFSLI